MVGRKTTEVYREPGQVLHFSEDLTIERFVLRIAVTGNSLGFSGIRLGRTRPQAR